MSMSIVKSFIRPMWEYGMGVEVLPKGVVDDIQRVQNMALRKVLSAGRGTSIAAMHIMCKMEYVEVRNQQLNMQYFQEVFHGEKKRHPIGKVARKESKGWRKLSAKSSIKRFIVKNIWGKRVVSGESFSKEDVGRLNRQRWRKERKDSRVCHGLRLATVGQGDPMMHVLGLSRRELYYLWQWKLGTCGGQWRRCTACASPLSREHFLQCGGADRRIKEILRELGNRRIRWPGTVHRLNWMLESDALRESEDKVIIYKELATLLEACRVVTMEWEIKGDTYEDDEDPNEALNVKLRALRDRLKNKPRRKFKAISRRG